MSGWVPLGIGLGLGAKTPLVYLSIMVLVLVFAVGLLAMAKRMPKPGAFYTYVSSGLGPIPGLAAGFLSMIGILLIITSTLIFSGMQLSILVAKAGGPQLSWWAGALIVWLIAAAVSMRNVDVSTKVLGVFLLVEVLIVLIWDLRVFVNGGPQGRTLDLGTSIAGGSIGPALLFSIACLIGFESLQVFRSETKDPERTIPRATYLTVVLLAGFYAVGSWLYLVAFGTDAAIATAADPFSAYLGSLSEYVGTAVKDIANVLMITSGFATILAMMNVVSRYMFSLSRDGVLPRLLGHAHPKHQAPTYAATAVGALTLVMLVVIAIVKPDDATTPYVAAAGLGMWLIMVMMTATSVAVIGFFLRNKQYQASVWVRWIAPTAAAVGFGYIVYTATTGRVLIFGDEKVANWCIVIVCVIGILGMVYGGWLRSKRPKVYAHIGNQGAVDEISID